jgi:ATP-dependent Clp protease ATP-binding subunit ClpA
MTLEDDKGSISPPGPNRDFLHVVLELSLAEARAGHKDYLGVPHLFMALTRLDDGCTQDALQHLGHSSKQIHEWFRLALAMGKASTETPILPTRRLKEVLSRAEELATAIDSVSFVDERAIAQAILSTEEGVTHELLTKQGINPAQLLEQIRTSKAHTLLESETQEELYTLEQAIRLNPDNPSAHNQKGNVIRKLNRDDEGPTSSQSSY